MATVTATWRQYLACANAGDYFRATALFSDAGFQRVYAQNGAPLSDEEVAIIRSGGEYPVGEPIPYLSLLEPRLLGDGRVGAVIETDEDAPFEAVNDQSVVFVNIDGRWLIDGFVIVADTAPVARVQEPVFAAGVGSTVQPTEDGVNLRSGPGFDAEPITVLDRNDILTITGPAEVTSEGEMWWPVVTSDGIRGFVLGDFIQVIG